MVDMGLYTCLYRSFHSYTHVSSSGSFVHVLKADQLVFSAANNLASTKYPSWALIDPTTKFNITLKVISYSKLIMSQFWNPEKPRDHVKGTLFFG